MVSTEFLQHSINISINTERKNKMKLLKQIWSIFCAIGQARYAAELSRGGKWQQAQALYKK